MNATGWLGLAWLGLAWLGLDPAGMEVHAMYPWLNPTCQDIGVSTKLIHLWISFKGIST